MKLAGYKKIRLLSAGSHWSHFEAVDAALGARVWLLVFKLPAEDEILSALKSIVREAAILNHPNILTPLDAKRIDDALVLVYPVFAGESLQSLILRGVPIVERRVTAVLKQAAAALQFARIRGFAHGLLSPEQVFLSNTSDEVKVFGFGLGRFLRSIVQSIDSDKTLPPVCEIDDAFALGALAYQMLIGKIIPDLSPEKAAFLRPPKEINPKLSQPLSDLVCSLMDTEEHRRAPISRVVDLLLPQPQEEELDKAPEKGAAAFLTERFEKLKKYLHMRGSRGRWAVIVTVLSLTMVTILTSVLMRYASGGLKGANREEYFKFIQEAAEPNLASTENEKEKENVNQGAQQTTRLPVDPLKIDESPLEKRIERNSAVFVFPRPPFADRIRIDNGELQPLPASLEIPFGTHRIAFYDSEFGPVWETIRAFDPQSERTVSFSPQEIGMGELAVVLKDAEKYGYVYVTIDGERQITTPCRVQLSAGRHHVCIYKQNIKVSPADTIVLITPLKRATIPATIIEDTGQ
ncbi:MAG: hypothetical protein ONB24_02705 [candidate division KSB1 bacterium]|nr:hypothetical protein [candidate division KSB1 bacterium]